jgi:hypothetical protein
MLLMLSTRVASDQLWSLAVWWGGVDRRGSRSQGEGV